VFAVNPLQAARYRERHTVSGARSDRADAHTLADRVRTDSHQLRPVAGDSPQVEAIKVVVCAHKTPIWERTRHTQRHALREYFPAALAAFEDLAAADTLELLTKAPDPVSAGRLTLSQISAALKRARRRTITELAGAIHAALRAEHTPRQARIGIVPVKRRAFCMPPAWVRQQPRWPVAVAGTSCRLRNRPGLPG
jgi:hypothetical protein